MTTQLVAGDEVVFVETNPLADRVPVVSWAIDGEAVPKPGNLLTLDLGALRLNPGKHRLTATVGDPASPSVTDQVGWGARR